MIDKVTLKLPIVIDKRILSRHRWIRRERPSKYNQDVTNVFYFKNKNNISLMYHENKHMLRVVGRFITFSKIPNRVDNLDELYGGLLKLWATAEPYEDDTYNFYKDSNGEWQYEELEPEYDYTIHGYAQNLDDVLNDINTLLYELTETELEIREFKIEKIEVCFNLYTEYVEQYIILFNDIFKEMTDPRYSNYVFEQQKQLYTSFYVKTKGEYEKNSRQNYTVNFYNKLDQLLFLKDKNYYGQGEQITDHDLDLARNVLRMEVQVNYYYLKKVFEKNGLDFTTRAFFQLIDIDLCANIIKDKYRFFIDKNMYLDFHSYRDAKDIVERFDLTRIKKANLLNYMLKRSRNNNVSHSELKTYGKMLADMGIHNYFIPKSMGIDYLPSPMKLLDEKVEDINQRRAEYMAEEDPYDFLGYYRYQLKQLKTL